MSVTYDHQRLTVSEVAADRDQLMEMQYITQLCNPLSALANSWIHNAACRHTITPFNCIIDLHLVAHVREATAYFPWAEG